MTWIYLVVAGILEVVWATALKMSQGFSQLGASVVTVVGMILSFVFLGLAVKHLPLSLAYPIWTGIGAVGSILVGVICFRDRLPAITWLFRAFRLCSSRASRIKGLIAD
ncbi:DMT family transporter [Pediococcus acidilactici]|uniref:DMT family transporter n=2 Tax=Pediococcus acidilactici TaxID=1254 RepID=UPI00137C1310|nr:multidrug efflux SMR transporter [Pediococcus acidilactici]QHS02810.1 multidrug efflux SMR transporter [Pediococcus acidilactici]